jgi:hypothetical protein
MPAKDAESQREGRQHSVFPIELLELLARRGECWIFTGLQRGFARMCILIWDNESGEKPRPARGLQKIHFSSAPFPVMRLWTGCTRLKIRVLTTCDFSLTENIEGVQQDRSLTAS